MFAGCSLNTTSSTASPHVSTRPQHQLGAGFDFDSGRPAVDTSTLRSAAADAAAAGILQGISSNGSCTADAAAHPCYPVALSGAAGRRRTTANYFTASGSTAQGSRRSTAPIAAASSAPGAGGVASPDSDSSPTLGGVGAGIGALGGLDGLSPSSEGAGAHNHARRLSQQALSEVGDW